MNRKVGTNKSFTHELCVYCNQRNRDRIIEHPMGQQKKTNKINNIHSQLVRKRYKVRLGSTNDGVCLP